MVSPVFKEVQRFRQVWIWVLVLVPVVISWWAFYKQVVVGDPFGSRPGPDWLVWTLFIVFGIGFPLLFYSLRLVTEVWHDRVRVALKPFHSRVIKLEEIESVEAREYRPVVEYGGWGYRISPKNGVAYNVYGKTGVQLVLTDDRKVLIGSQRSEELARAINSVRGR